MAITRRGVFVSGSAIAALSTLYDAHGDGRLSPALIAL